jgi:predicted esterase
VIAALALTALVATGSMESLEGGGHPYRVYWPERPLTGMLVFLHGVSLDPMEEEGEGVEALADAANKRGLIAVVPIGDRMCDFSKNDVERCWNLSSIEDELSDIRKIMADVEKLSGHALRERQLIGFSNGGYLVAGALQRGLLAGFTRIGIVAAGTVGDNKPPLAVRPPRVFIEVGSDDRWSISATRDLVDNLDDVFSVSYREVPGGHVWDYHRAADFLDWFWAD